MSNNIQWYVLEYKWSIQKYQTLNTLKVLVMVHYYFPWQTIFKKILIVSRKIHVMTCYKTILYKQLTCYMVKHLLANKISTTLLFCYSILKYLSLIKIFQANIEGSRKEQRWGLYYCDQTKGLHCKNQKTVYSVNNWKHH